jgi:hypothetical protein
MLRGWARLPVAAITAAAASAATAGWHLANRHRTSADPPIFQPHRIDPERRAAMRQPRVGDHVE